MDITTHNSLLLFTTVAAGINSGAFFAFSNFVMSSLGRLAPAEGARAMQEINRGAPNLGFMLTLMGGAASGVAIAVTAGGRTDAGWLAAGGLLSAATALITVGFHVPRNNRLARVDAETVQGQAVWAAYRVEWTRGNHVRTATSALSVACLVIAVAA